MQSDLSGLLARFKGYNMQEFSGRARVDRDIVRLAPSSRKRCDCGCKKRATHMGTGQGAGMMIGCEFYVRRWVRDGAIIFRIKSR